MNKIATVKRKLTLREGEVGKALTAEEGCVKTKFIWLVSEEVDAKNGTSGYAELPDGSIYELHTRPNADEVFDVISDHGAVQYGSFGTFIG